MKSLLRLAVVCLALPLAAQTPTSAGEKPTAPDPWKPLAFLEGTWEAKTTGTAGVAAVGTYTFRTELDRHILARHSTTNAGCKGPVTFDCEHGDLLYIFHDTPSQALKAIYFDNEGHVIQYDVSLPTPTSVSFLSDASRPGPQFRLVYERKGAILMGRFQVRVPGQTEWRSYLEWSGGKQPPS